jgi:anti-anti-sigma regulatory factor
MPAQLIVVAGPDLGRAFPLAEGQTVVIGRGQNTDTKLTDPQVSRVHCRVRLDGRRLHLADAGSSSGTLVNNHRVVEQDLAGGITFQIGATRLRFDLDGSQDETTLMVSSAGRVLATADAGERHYRHLKVHAERGVVVLIVTEPQILDEELAEALRVEMLMAIAHAPAGDRRVIVDLHAVKTVSSAVCRPLTSLRSRLSGPGDRLVLCGLNMMLRELLRVSGLIEPSAPSGPCFDVAADQSAALARVGRAD